MAQRFQETVYVPCCLSDSDSASVTLFGEAETEQLEKIPALRGTCTLSVKTGCADFHVRLTAAKARELAGLLLEIAGTFQTEALS